MKGMQYYEEHMQAFLNNPPESMAIFGAGEAGSLCLKWLGFYGLQDRVVCFFDNDANKQNSSFCGKAVYSPKKIIDEQIGIPIVIATDFFREVKAGMDKLGCKNQFFVSNNRMLCLICDESEAIEPVPVESVYPYYSIDDLETRELIDYCMLIRKYKGGGVIPFESAQEIPISFDYWDRQDVSLEQFSKITMIDAGAYTGDTLGSFFSRENERIELAYAFEPDKRNFDQLSRFAEKTGISSRCELIRAGVSDNNETIMVNESDDNTGITFNLSEKGDVPVEIVRIDDCVDKVIGKLCIKMDIEGFELAALKGARETILKHKPELAICVYHKNEDIWKIPKYIKSLVPEYNIWLRCNSHMECYASVERFGSN